MQLNRLFAAAAVFRMGVCAATMESSSGSAIVAPTPRRNVRRGRCFFVMNAIVSSLGSTPNFQCPTPNTPGPVWELGVGVWTVVLRRQFHLHLKRIALHDPDHERREVIPVLRGIARDLAHDRHVVIPQRPAGA